MARKILPIIAIFFFTVLAWMILAGVTAYRASSSNKQMYSKAQQLWGEPQRQQVPEAYYTTEKKVKIKKTDGSKTYEEESIETERHNVNIESSDIKADIKLEYRKKGLVWCSMYKIGFNALYTVKNTTSENRNIHFI